MDISILCAPIPWNLDCTLHWVLSGAIDYRADFRVVRIVFFNFLFKADFFFPFLFPSTFSLVSYALNRTLPLVLSYAKHNKIE